MNETTQIETPNTTKVSQYYAKWLWLCSILFAFRLAAQLAAFSFRPSFLPSFESWHGGVLPYSILLTTQVCILCWLVWTAHQFSLNRPLPHRRLGLVVTLFASSYFALMLLRLILGLTILSDHRWFTSFLPAFFHLVLASYLLLYGHFHFCHGRK